MSTDHTPPPCPFCGHVGLDFREGSTYRWLLPECHGCGAGCGETRIQTMGQGTREEWFEQARQDAIKTWNTRAAPQQAEPVAQPVQPAPQPPKEPRQ